MLQFVREACESDPAHRNAAGVLGLVDQYGVKHKYLMNVGSKKGSIVARLIEERKPACMIELGSYIGYSTVLFGDAVKRGGGKQYISFERDPKFAQVASALVELAGLSDIVTFVVGSSSKNIFAQHASGNLKTVDMMFLDHYKPAYVRDLKICESLGLIQKGTILAADNVISPGNPSYLEYVRSTPEQKQKKLAEDGSNAGTVDKRFHDRTVNQYSNVEEDDAIAPGNPSIVYESYLVESEEPTGERDGVEITSCIHR